MAKFVLRKILQNKEDGDFVFGCYHQLIMRIDNQMVYSSIPELLASDNHNYNSEDFYVFDSKVFAKVEEIFTDDDLDEWVSLQLSNGRSISLSSDQQLVIGRKLIEAGSLKEGDKIPWWNYKVPNVGGKRSEVKISQILPIDARTRIGYELMTDSGSYIVGGIQLASI